MRHIKMPEHGEYPSYADMYMKWLPDDGLILNHMKDNFRKVKEFVYGLPDEKLYHRYAPGKWSVKETLVHIVDDERIYAYRALCIARNEKNNLNGFEQESYVRYSDADHRELDNIFNEYEAVRNATITLFNGLPEDSLTRMGTGDGKKYTVRALAFHIAGHELHHFNLIKTVYR